jgi:hypothetical protein
MIYLESIGNMFTVSFSTQAPMKKTCDYDAALKFAMEQAEFSRCHLVILTGTGRIRGNDVVIIGRAGFRQIRSVYDRRKNPMRLAPEGSAE